MSHPVALSPFFAELLCLHADSKSLLMRNLLEGFGQVNAVDFFEDSTPGSDGVVFFEEELSMVWDDSPFLLEDGPGLLRGGGEYCEVRILGSAFGAEVGNLIQDKGADEAKVAARSCEDAVLAVGVPLFDAVFEFGWAVELDFL